MDKFKTKTSNIPHTLPYLSKKTHRLCDRKDIRKVVQNKR